MCYGGIPMERRGVLHVSCVRLSVQHRWVSASPQSSFNGWAWASPTLVCSMSSFVCTVHMSDHTWPAQLVTCIMHCYCHRLCLLSCPIPSLLHCTAYALLPRYSPHNVLHSPSSLPTVNYLWIASSCNCTAGPTHFSKWCLMKICCSWKTVFILGHFMCIWSKKWPQENVGNIFPTLHIGKYC